MRIKRRSQAPLAKKAKRRFRGYPIATVAYYGPDDSHATKIAVAIIPSEGADATELERWFSAGEDIRRDEAVAHAILAFIQRHGARSVATTDRIIGCPHEEGIDYPIGEKCPRCPYWANRDRWTGEVIQ